MTLKRFLAGFLAAFLLLSQPVFALPLQVSPSSTSSLISLSYDRNDNLATVNDRLGRTVTFTYDSANQLIRKTLPSGEAVAYGYDLSGNLQSVADADSGLLGERLAERA